jgi:hypothetical protein
MSGDNVGGGVWRTGIVHFFEGGRDWGRGIFFGGRRGRFRGGRRKGGLAQLRWMRPLVYAGGISSGVAVWDCIIISSFFEFVLGVNLFQSTAKYNPLSRMWWMMTQSSKRDEWRQDLRTLEPFQG